MKYGIKINVGKPTEPEWKWLYNGDMTRYEFTSSQEAEAQKELWYLNHKHGLVRVVELEEVPSWSSPLHRQGSASTTARCYQCC